MDEKRFCIAFSFAGEKRAYVKQVAAVARGVYRENYEACPMRHTLERDARDPSALALNGCVTYEWRLANRWQKLAAQTVGAAQPLVVGSEEEFITEHYWGYAAQRDGGCVEYKVEHPPWQVRQVSHLECSADATALYGAQFAQTLSVAPVSAFVAEGSAVTVRRGVRIN